MDKEAEDLKKEYIFLTRLIQRHTSNQVCLQRTSQNAPNEAHQCRVVERSATTRTSNTMKPSKNLVYRPVNKALSIKTAQLSGHGDSISGPSPTALTIAKDVTTLVSPHRMPLNRTRSRLSQTIAKSRYKLQKVHNISISPQQVSTVKTFPKGVSAKCSNAPVRIAVPPKASGSERYCSRRINAITALSPTGRAPVKSLRCAVSKYKLVRSNPKNVPSRTSETNLTCLGARRIVRKYKVNNVGRPSKTPCSTPSANKAMGQKQKNFWNLSYRSTHYYKGQKRLNTSGSSAGATPSSWSHLIKVGNITYKGTKTKLLRTHRQSLQRSFNEGTPNRAKVLVVRGVAYCLDPSGKTLKRIVQHPTQNTTPMRRIDVGGKTYIERTPGTLCESPSTETRTFLSRAINRSLQQVRSAVNRKYDKRTTQYCMFFNRFGRCNKGERCAYIHDPEKVAVCTRFLRGTCRVSECPFSHRVSPNKMPVCSFFLRGCCTMEPCPYRHVKVSRDAEICRDFVRGYCSEGIRCKKQHILICPEFAATQQCSKGKQCILTHRKRPAKRKISEPKPRADASASEQQQTSHICSPPKQAEKEDATSVLSERPGAVDLSMGRKKLVRQPQYISLKEYESPQGAGFPTSAQTKGASSRSGAIRIRPSFLP